MAKTFINTTATGRKDGHVTITKFADSPRVLLTAYRKRSNGKVIEVGSYLMFMHELKAFVTLVEENEKEESKE